MQVGSYNVNGRMPDSNLDLKPWIDAAGIGADIVAVAFQEIVPLNAQNVVIGTFIGPQKRADPRRTYCIVSPQNARFLRHWRTSRHINDKSKGNNAS